MNTNENPVDAPIKSEEQKRPEKIKKQKLARWWRRPLQIALLVICLGIAVPVLIPLARLARLMFTWERTVDTTLTLLKSESLMFLVTDRLTSQIMVQISEKNPFLGKKEGILVGTVTLYYGIDLRNLDPDSISRDGKILAVTIPEPRELDFSVDPSSLECITKKTGMNIIADFVMNKDMEDELRNQLKETAVAFFTDHELMPSRQKILHQLNEFAPLLSEKIGMTVEFR